VEFENEERTIEFHKDEQKSAVTNQDGLVCVTITAIVYFYIIFIISSSLGHGECPICCWKKLSDGRNSVLPMFLLMITFKIGRLVSSGQIQVAWRLFAPYSLEKVKYLNRPIV
jgi:hypothetical protein